MVGPLPAHELAMPSEEGRRGDKEGDPAVTRDRSARRREQDPVDGPELRSARRPLQHAQLMAEDEDLEVLGAVVPVRSTTTDEQTDEGADDEVEERPHQPIVLGGPIANRGFRTPRAIRLCGGFWSGFGGSSFRGKVYMAVVRRVAGASLTREWIPPDEVRDITAAFERYDPARVADESTHDPYPISETEVLELGRFFRLCAERGLGLIGWS